MKKIVKTIVCIAIIITFGIIYISYVTDHNIQEMNKLKTKIEKNYSLTEKIIYTNQYGNFYIIKTPTKVIVLEKNYKLVMEEDINKLSSDLSNLDLVYKTNKLMYEKKTNTKNKLKYKYYDAFSGNLLKETMLEMQ